jgi:hypothetical protein
MTSKTLVIVAASNKMRTAPARAAEMFKGSLFLQGLELAEQLGADVRILSGTAGWLMPDSIVEHTSHLISHKQALKFKSDSELMGSVKEDLNGYDTIYVIASRHFREFLSSVWDARFVNLINSNGIIATRADLKAMIGKLKKEGSQQGTLEAFLE